MTTTRCRHCRDELKVCYCGADHGQPHWVDVRYHGSRWCRGKNQRHESLYGAPPAAPKETDQP